VVGSFLIVFPLGVSAGFLALQRAAWKPIVQTPVGLLDYLQRRLQMSERAAELVRWAGLVASIFTLCVVGETWLTAQAPPSHEAVRKLVSGLATIGSTFAVTWTAPWWASKVMARRRRELARWREELLVGDGR
jgi:hypothetical protein